MTIKELTAYVRETKGSGEALRFYVNFIQPIMKENNSILEGLFETKLEFIESPVVTIDNFYNGEKVLVIHNYINEKGKMILTKEEAALLFVELYKFIKS